MKYRVVGWTYYDDLLVESKYCSESALQAIIEEIKQKGYEFTGYDHQNTDACVPVLNDGKKRLFSQREFGGIMAKAHGDYSRMGYSYYAFNWHDPKALKLPEFEDEFDADKFVPETDLNEEIILEVSSEIFKQAKSKKHIVVDDHEILKFVDVGDTLTLVCGEEKQSFLIEDLERRKDLTKKQMNDIMGASYASEKIKKHLDKLYLDAKWVVEFKLK